MPRSTLADVAARAGVSTATASLVLRGKPGPSQASREAVRAAADELSYRPDRTASLLARRRSRLIGVLFDVRSPFHTELIDELDGAAADSGYDLVLAPVTTRRTERHAVENLLDFRCEAVILIGPGMSDQALERVGAGCQAVVVGRPAVPGVDAVRAADTAGVAAAVDHLVALGHRSIAFVDGPRGPIATARRRGYREAMRRHGLGEWVDVRTGGATEERGAAAGRALMADPRSVTAAIAFNDQCAIGLRDTLVRNGCDVPGQFSLVGFDDSPPAGMATLSLTSVSQDPPGLAAACLRTLTARLDSHRWNRDVIGATAGGPSAGPASDLPDPAAEVVVPTRLVVRNSTAPPPR